MSNSGAKRLNNATCKVHKFVIQEYIYYLISVTLLSHLAIFRVASLTLLQTFHRWEGHVGCMCEKKGVYRVLVGET
jgi:hypothetical protein